MTPELLLSIASIFFLVQAIRLVADRNTRIAPPTAFMTFGALVMTTVGLVASDLRFSGGLAAVQAALWLWLALFGESRAGRQSYELINQLQESQRRVGMLIRVNRKLAARAFAPELTVQAGNFGGHLDPDLFIPGTNQLREEVNL